MSLNKDEIELIKSIVNLYPDEVELFLEIKKIKDKHFGSCSIRGKDDGYLNVGKTLLLCLS